MTVKPEVQLLGLCRSHFDRARKTIPSFVRSNARSTWISDVDSFIVSYWLGFALLTQSRPWAPCLLGHARQLLNNLTDCSGYLEFIESCNALRSELVSTGSTTCLSKGKTRWARSLIRLITETYGRPIQHPSAEFDQVATYLGWFKRVPIFIRDRKISIEDYRERDRQLSNIDVDNPYVDLLRDLWHEWFGSFRLTRPFRPRHGSGSTADAGRVAADKWRSLSFDDRARICMKSPDLKTLLPCIDRDNPRRAKVVLVPKQAGKDRTICMEPAWLQFLQQGIFDQLRDYLQKSACRRHFDIHNQDINRDLCHRAYLEGLSTIDLSNASDSVSWALIRRICKGMPLYRYLYASRSDEVDLYGDIFVPNKYAPMGSALCFPIECMLFASIVEVAYRIHYEKPSEGHRSGVSVYGDDIICPEEIYPLVVDILTTCGFEVNESKSYHFGPYFESCGVEYLYGALITTIKHPRANLHSLESASPDEIGLVTDLANTLLDFGSLTARRFLLALYRDKRVDVGSKSYRFNDLLHYGPSGLRTVGIPYGTLSYDRHVQRSYAKQLVVKAEPRQTGADWIHYACNSQYQTDRSGSETLALVSSGSIHPKWSQRGIISLIKMGHYDLLVDGDVTSVGPCRAGRLRYTVKSSRLYV